MTGKIALVTGGNGGMGKATAVGLARAGHHVVLLARDEKKLRTAADEVKALANGARVDTLRADLSSMQDVRRAAAEFQTRYARLDTLVLAHAVFLPAQEVTAEGNERTFATNYLSQFLLVNLLVPTLKKSAPARVVFISSRYGGTKIDWADPQRLKKKHTVFGSVGPTKMAQVAFARELADRLAGSGVTVNAMHPGLVKTQLLDNVAPGYQVLNWFAATPEKGAAPALWLATAPELATVTGKFWNKTKEMAITGQIADAGERKRLWDESARLVKLDV